MTTVLAYLPLAVLLFFVVLTTIGAVQLLSRRLHPLRILTLSLSNAFVLLLWALLVPLVSVLAATWWVLVAATALGIVVASLRAARPLTVPPADPAATRRQERRRLRLLRRLSAPSISDIVTHVVLLAGSVALALSAG